MIYSSIENNKIKEIKKLNKKKYRDQLNLFLVEGYHLIEEAYVSGCLESAIILEGNDIDFDIEKIFVSEKVMKYISELQTPNDFIGICRKKSNNKIGNKIVMLDNLQDPGNMGTIIRSCVAFECDTLIVSDNSVDIYNSKVIRASQGMIFKLNIIVTDLKKMINSLKDYKIIGTDVNGGKSVNEFDKSEKFAIIMGNEGKGLSEEIKNMCSDYIYIKMSEKCESLNVGVATSIILYELSK